MRLDAVHLRRGRGEARQVEAGAAAQVEHDAPGPVGAGAHGVLDEPVAVDGVVLQLVRRRVLPDVGARDRAPGKATGLRRRVRQTRTSPFGVWNCAAMMPGRAVRGDPLDLDVLERRLDGLAEPLADPLRVTGDLEAGQGPVGAAAGRRVQLVGAQPLHEERQLRVGDQAVDADLLPQQLGAVGAVAVARDGLAAEALLDGAMSSTRRPSRASRRRGRSGRARPGRTAPCRRPGGRAPRPPRGRCGRPAAGPCCASRTAGGCHRRRSHGRATPRCAGRCRRGRQGRRRS